MVEATLLAFDYGEVRIGVAIGNTLTRQARALTVLANSSVVARFGGVAKLIDAWQPAHLIVGLPCYADGTAHDMTHKATRFGNQLRGRFNVPVTWVDERYSTVAARASGLVAPGKAADAQAACIILQQFFDTYTDLSAYLMQNEKK
ncbi:MAG: Holliday junction resolvase RuvX [Ottowia sp.]|nr:Holliday junction resolvase RuvX [Ottowia sp.]